jgi:hypothetical protein
MTPKTARSSMSALERAHREQAALELFAGAVADALAQSDRGGHVECLELVEQPRAFRDRGAPNVQQRPQRRERPAPAWRREVLASEYALGRGERVDAVGLPHAALRPPRTFDLDDGVAGVLQVLAETGAPAACSLDAEHEPIQVAVALGPTLQLGITGSRRRELELAQDLAKRVQRHRAVALLVGVDPDCDHRYLLIVWNGPGDVEAAGQSCVE